MKVPTENETNNELRLEFFLEVGTRDEMMFVGLNFTPSEMLYFYSDNDLVLMLWQSPSSWFKCYRCEASLKLTIYKLFTSKFSSNLRLSHKLGICFFPK